MAGRHADPETAQGAGGAARTWRSTAGLAAVVVIAAQLLWRSILLSHGYFSQDDFLAMSTVQDGSWSDRLSGEYAGGFSPGGVLVVWLTMAVAPLGWGAAAVVVLALQTGATAMMWPVLTRLLGARWLRLPLLVLFALGTQTLWSTQWWVLGIGYWSATLLLLTGAWALLRALQDDDPRVGVVVVAAVAVALAFDERAVLHPVVLVGIALLAGTATTLRARLARAVRDLPWVWAGLVVLVAAYALLRWQVAPFDTTLGDQLGDVVTAYLRHGLAEAFAGPWTGSLPAHAYLVPTSWVVALNGAFLLALAGATLQRGGPAARASWLTLVLFVLGSVGMLALTGGGELVASLGLVHRYAAELAAVIAICLAGALSTVAFEPVRLGRWRTITAPRVEAAVAVLAVVLVAASAAISTAFLAPNLYHADDRRYVENLRADLRENPQVVLLDGGVPAGVISPWYGDRAMVSTVLAQAPENPVFDLPSHALRIVLPDGRLSPVRLEGAVRETPSQDPDCGYAVRSVGVEVPMAGFVPSGRWVLRIGYYTDTDGFLSIGVAGRTQRFPVRDGLNAVDLVVEGEFDGFRATLEDPDATLCLTDASAGVPRPDRS